MKGLSFKLLILTAIYLVTDKKFALGQDEEHYEAKLVEPLVHFGSDLMRTTRKEAENLILSPVSIQSALNLVLLGAKSDSDTEKELVKTLGYGSSDQCSQIHVAYSKLLDKFHKINEKAQKRRGAKRPIPVVDLWTKIVTKEDLSTLKPDYLNSVTLNYNTSVASVTKNNLTAASSVAKEINNWAKEAGFESELISGRDLEQDFSLLLLSAIRLESRWLKHFVAQQAEELFHNHGQLSSLVNGTALIGHDIDGRYVKFSQEHSDVDSDASRKKLDQLEFYAVSLPLMGDISFVCLVPLKSGPKVLAQLEDELLKGDTMLELLKALDEPKASIVFKRVQLPKFNFETELNLVEPLRSLGLATVFDGNRAELDEMSSSVASAGQFLSDAKHQALIEVNEVGLKAAAVTVIQAETLNDEPPSSPLELAIDKPFVFAVRLGRLPLFMGHLVHLS